MRPFSIGNFHLGKQCRPYIIAEIGVNHEGNFELAQRLVREAAEAGAHAAKFQSYKAEKIASRNSPAYWDQEKEPTESQFKLFKKYDNFNQAEYIALAEYCAELGIDFMSTPFDLEAADFLAPLVPAFKIASADITNIPLIRKCASKGKPLIISVGASTLPEIELAMTTASSAGATDIALLHCILNYPTPEEHARLGKIAELIRIFPDACIGYSDHVVPDLTMSALEVATLMGACILEKHFTHDKTLPGNDHYHAMNMEDLQRFQSKLEVYQRLLEDSGASTEAAARQHARRSIFSAKGIKKGEVFSDENLIAKRPAHGISPIHWDEIVGKTALIDIEEDALIHWSMVQEK